MPASAIFQIDMLLGYLAWGLCIATYVWPRLRAMDRVEAHRAIATLHCFRFFGLVFLLPGFVGPNLPEGFATPAAYGDLATGLLAILAHATMLSRRALIWSLLAGITGGLGLATLYGSLSSGRMGLASPVVAVLSVGIPAIATMTVVFLKSCADGHAEDLLRASESRLPAPNAALQS